MSDWLNYLPMLIPTALVAAVLVPDSLSRRHVTSWRRWTNVAVASQVAVLLCVFADQLFVPSFHATDGLLASGEVVSGDRSVASPVLLDGLSILMLLLVAFIGWVTCQYSIEYLDGLPNQSRYCRFSAVTIGAVSWMMASGHLAVFAAAWIAMNLALHQLLVLNPEQPGAKRAAWTKFAINRIGDAALIAGFGILFAHFNSPWLRDIFMSAGNMLSDSQSVPTPLVAAGAFLLIAAVIQSVQFPFHTWLPETLNSPTPVSALMHAGIVNAGGYLVIRFSPIFELFPTNLHVLAIIGLFTTVLAAAVMMTQTSVKKSLAYSTIAQMGFMMLQCGLGAYTAATVHIVAHSLYKANSFLRSGSVVSDAKATKGANDLKRPLAWYETTFAITASCVLFAIVSLLLNVSPNEKAGGLILGGILCLALSHWIGEAIQSGSRWLVAQCTAISGLICLLYVGCYLATDALIAGSLPNSTTPTSNLVVTSTIAAGFIGLLILQLRIRSASDSAWFQTLQIHASNGFYIDHCIRRFFRASASA
ncbi:proton-conducting transporter transmembrane domain-containing protein [Rhodopirellula europaea]|uniref:Probable inorganic carbon transporter subunit DabB n=1 Tax=Rhodopirellula europaea 6C TaxID=1263867 RepID=M2ADL0_9BACT|nr:proton-conducting transporter membrane subunit [Rhodopirellula europaea]EMB15180.1 NADH dehydrogenase subunit I L [Rhodopirellula europaea 6C]